MAVVIPFKCWRPRPDVAAEVAAAPYDTFSRAEASVEIAAHPLSFLRIDKPAALFGSEVDEYDPQVYVRAREELKAWYEQGVMVPDNELLEPTYLVYRIAAGNHTQIGIVACASVADYQSGVIKRHENTRPQKEQDRIEHIRALEAHTGPVLMTYPSQPELDKLLKECANTTPPIYSFVAPDGVCHELWRVENKDTIERIQAAFTAVSTLYIADGHHRAAAAARISEWHKQSKTSGCDAADYFLVALFGGNEMQVLDYNRIVSDLAGLQPEQLIAAIAEVMDVSHKGSEPYRPVQRGEFGLYLDGSWYKLILRTGERPDDVVEGLDVALLQNKILAPLLKISDPRTDARISYVGGARGLAELAERADKVGGAAFALYPCSLSELFAVADEDKLMPPKSTWFEPKPRSGLAIHRITD